jgi:hypothetical protein
MTYEEQHVKVTITIEDSEMIRTITIPKAREVDVMYEPRGVMVSGSNANDILLPIRPQWAGFQVRGVSDFDYESQQLVIVETVTKNPRLVPEVKVGKTTSELTPRELRRARFGGPRGGSPHIGRELKSKLKGKES